jgi:hypothetical protein
MKKAILLAGAAMLFATPAAAQSVDTSIEYENEISVSQRSDSATSIDINIDADLEFESDGVELDSAANAGSDVKQIIRDNDVRFDEADGTASTTNNNANSGAVAGTGNTGVNVAAGWYNSQANVGTIAVSADGSGGDGGDSGETNTGGAAVANTTGYQSVMDTSIMANDLSGSDADTATSNNNAGTGAIGGSGNVSVNVAAGAFNAQANIMTLASATDSSLANSTAGVIQSIRDNHTTVMNGTNNATGGGVNGAGNIGVNIAAGVGNVQHNSLTVASGSATAD